MILVNNNAEFQLFELDSEAELRSLSPPFLLGQQAQLYQEFFLIKIKNENQIGIITEGHGIKPNIKMFGEGVYYIAFDNHMFLFKTELEKTIERTVDSLIQAFYFDEQSVIVICEIDVYAFTLDNLQETWHIVADDLILDYVIGNDIVTIKTEKVQKIISLESGNMGA